MSEWQDISTAPKDGTYVLLSNKFGTWVGKHQEVFTSGYRPPNPWKSMMLNHDHIPYVRSIIPSHWMPLPPPPQETNNDAP